METLNIPEQITYPIGEQDFRSLRRDGCEYVDKTRYIAKILASKNKYFFLARPRRFGKSLFLSTLKYFFEGERELFKGLAIDAYNLEWAKVPVLHLDLNNGEYTNPENLDKWVGNLISIWEKEYEVTDVNYDLSTRFYNVIKSAYEKTGQQVVILVDEYDKPLVKNLNKEEFEIYREKLAALYSNFKTCAHFIRLVFLTGVSRFSKLTVFSGLNNLNDITFVDDFADICGITEKEMLDKFRPGIQDLADKMRVSFDEAVLQLKRNYDGYRFAAEGSDIYNPWSLINCLAKREILNYWNHTGIPTIIAETLYNSHADLEECLDCECDKDNLLGLDLKSADPTALLYQTGYITIKDYDPDYQTFTLGIPNMEVCKGLFEILLPYYVEAKRKTAGKVVANIVASVRKGEPEKLMQSLQAYFAGVPYGLQMDNENNFQNAFYILATLLDIDTQAEVQTSEGRIDMLLQSKKFIFLIELKYDGCARAALDQIERKRYALRFTDDPRRLYRIGASFSSSTRTIGDWLIE